jgi:hypothetical protein
MNNFYNEIILHFKQGDLLVCSSLSNQNGIRRKWDQLECIFLQVISKFLYSDPSHHQRGIRGGQNPSGAATSHADCGTGKPGQD